MLQNYLPILLFLGMGVMFALVPMALGWWISPKNPDPSKNAAYECGFEAFEDARLPFDVRFYLVAILFILFDLETAFLFPWAIVLRTIGWMGMIAMSLFVGLLIIGFIYEWKSGALEWE